MKDLSAIKYKLHSATIGLMICFWCIVPILTATAIPITLEPDDPLIGTWVSEEYDSTGRYNAKWVIYSDGTEFDYPNIDDTEPAEEVRNVFEQKWIDSEGWYWYKIRSTFWVYPSGTERTVFLLARINPIGTTLESVLSLVTYPEEISIDGIYYRILYKRP